jgi:hypothetical protein
MAPKTRSQARTALSPAGSASPLPSRKFYVEVPARPRAITPKTRSAPLPACSPARSPVHPPDAPRDLLSTLAELSASLKALTDAVVAQGRTITELASTLRAPKPTPPATTPNPPVESPRTVVASPEVMRWPRQVKPATPQPAAAPRATDPSQFEVVIKASRLPQDDPLRQMNGKALRDKIEGLLNVGQPAHKAIKLARVVVLQSGDWRLQPANVEHVNALRTDASLLRRIDARLSAATPWRTHGVIVHNVPIDVEPDCEVGRSLVEQTIRSALGDSLVGVVSTSRIRARASRERGEQKRAQSVLVLLSDPSAARRLDEMASIDGGALAPRRRLLVVGWNPAARVRQCQRCAKFQHIRRECKAARPSCLRCGKAHLTERCDMCACPTVDACSHLRCVNCRAPQAAWHRDCPARRAAENRAPVPMASAIPRPTPTVKPAPKFHFVPEILTAEERRGRRQRAARKARASLADFETASPLSPPALIAPERYTGDNIIFHQQPDDFRELPRSRSQQSSAESASPTSPPATHR